MLITFQAEKQQWGYITVSHELTLSVMHSQETKEETITHHVIIWFTEHITILNFVLFQLQCSIDKMR